MLERLASKNAEKVRIVKVDVSANGEWAHEQKIRGVPTFQIYSGGNKVEQFAGAPPETALQQKIDHHAVNVVSSGERTAVSRNGDAAPAPEPVMKPMPKEWLPPGVTRK